MGNGGGPGCRGRGFVKICDTSSGLLVVLPSFSVSPVGVGGADFVIAAGVSVMGGGGASLGGGGSGSSLIGSLDGVFGCDFSCCCCFSRSCSRLSEFS